MQFSLAKHQPGDGEQTERRTVGASQHRREINLILLASLGGNQRWSEATVHSWPQDPAMTHQSLTLLHHTAFRSTGSLLGPLAGLLAALAAATRGQSERVRRFMTPDMFHIAASVRPLAGGRAALKEQRLDHGGADNPPT